MQLKWLRQAHVGDLDIEEGEGWPDRNSRRTKTQDYRPQPVAGSPYAYHLQAHLPADRTYDQKSPSGTMRSSVYSMCSAWTARSRKPPVGEQSNSWHSEFKEEVYKTPAVLTAFSGTAATTC
jgi:hypothetical protein